MGANTVLLRFMHRRQPLVLALSRSSSLNSLGFVSQRAHSTDSSNVGTSGSASTSKDSSPKSPGVADDKATETKASPTGPVRGASGPFLKKTTPDGTGTMRPSQPSSPPQPGGRFRNEGRFTGTKSPPRTRDSRGAAGPFKPPPTPPQSGENKLGTTDSTSASSIIRPHKSHWDRKPNFAKTVLEPAAQGHLNKGHDSGIPKLTARKHKSSTVKDEFPQRQDRVEALSFNQQLQSPESVMSETTTTGLSKDKREEIAIRPRILPRVEDIISGRTSIKSVVEQYSKQRFGVEETPTAIVTMEEEKSKGESSFQQQPLGKIMSRQHLISLFQAPSTQSLNSHVSNEILPIGPKRSANFIALQRRITESYIKTGMDSWGDSLTKTQKEELIKEQQQIQNQFTMSKRDDGSSSKEYGIWPTEYKEYTLNLPLTDSRREPRPIAHPTNRSSPPMDFVQGKHGTSKTPFQSFLFVQRIPHPVFEETVEDASNNKKIKKMLGQFDQPTHRHSVSEYVSSILGVDISQVCPSSMTSAFVGFDSPEQAANVVLAYRLRKSSTNDSSSHAHSLSNLKVDLLDRKEMGDLFLNEEASSFLSSSTPEDVILQVSNIPAGMKAGSLFRFLHGLDSTILPKDHILAKDQIQMVDPTTAWIRVSHPVSASALGKIESHLRDKMIPNQAFLLLPAQRSILHSGYTGPARHYPIQRLGSNLIVHGDTPSLDFFRSHAMVLHLTNFCEKVTPSDIARHFQKYCVEPRDVIGSTEYIYDLEGHFTGRVYVGFDLQEEGMAAWKGIEELGQRIQIVAGEDSIVTDGSFIRVRTVQEKDVKRGQKLTPRTYRSEEELLQSLMDWDKYVDESDIQYLESMGVGKHVLAEAFMAVRHNNPTFGTEDWARQGEKLRNEKKPGHHFRQFVKLYIETLKEVATTREKPGMLFEGMFVPGEELDLSVFDREEARLEKLKREYEE